ncbi:Ca2-binding protein [Aureococcus anophagefferens]|nr:Ca2-binding protein [Aureococcus anophagefferens]
MDIEITRDEAADVLEAVGGRDGAPVADVAKLLESAAGAGKKEEPAGFRLLRSEIRRLGQRSEGPPDYKRVFRALDRDGSGYLEPREFRRGLEKLGFEELSSEDLRAVVDRLDVDGDGRVSLREFLKFADGAGDDRTTRLERAVFKEVSYAEFVGWCDRGAGAAREDQDDVLKLLRDACRDRLDGGSSPRAVFERLDRDGDGTVDEDDSSASRRSAGAGLPAGLPGSRRGRVGRLERREFRRGLEKLGFEFDGGEFDRVVERLDRDGDGTVSLREFLKFAEGAGSRPEDSDDAVDEVMGRLRGLVRDAVQDGLSPADCFEHFDRDGSGDVDEREFTKGMKKLGVEMTAYEVRKVMDRFPGGRRGRVRYRDFVKARERAAGALRALRKEAKRSRDRRGKRPNYARAFDAYDYAGDGAVSRADLDRAFATLGFELSSSDARRVADRFDRGGAVAWRDLARYADGDGDGDEDDDDDALKRLRSLVRDAVDDGLSPDDIFAHFDLDGDGTIDEREFAKAMKKLGVSLSSREVRKTMAQFPGRREGRLKYRDFLKAILPSSRSKRSGDRSPRRSPRSSRRY